MIRLFGVLLLGLAAARGRFAGHGAKLSAAGPVYRGPPPPNSVYDYDDDDDQGMYRPLPPGQRLPPDPRYRAYPDERALPPPPGARQYDSRQYDTRPGCAAGAVRSGRAAPAGADRFCA